MTPQELEAWITVAEALANVGIHITTSIRSFIAQAHPTLTPEEVSAAYDAIMADDAVREAIARQGA
jgi:hypothetical protein